MEYDCPCRLFLAFYCFIRIKAATGSEKPSMVELTEIFPPKTSSTCSEFVNLPAKSSSSSLFIIAGDAYDTPAFGFRAYVTRCNALPKRTATKSDVVHSGLFGDEVFSVATHGQVKMLKSFTVEKNIYLIVVVENFRSQLYEIIPPKDKEGVYQMAHKQHIPYEHLTDVTVLKQPGNGDVFLAFSAYEIDSLDRTRPHQSIGVVYRFADGALWLCDCVRVTRAVSVRGFDSNGVPTFVFASYLDRESDSSALSFFEAFSDEDFVCRIVPRKHQAVITKVDGRGLCGIQAIEPIVRGQQLLLAVALSPVGLDPDCPSDALKESFILLPDHHQRNSFDTKNVARLAEKRQFSGFNLIATSCGEMVQAYGFLSKTVLFSVEYSANTFSVRTIPTNEMPSNTVGSSIGYCGKHPLLSFSRPDSTEFLNRNKSDGFETSSDIPVLKLDCIGRVPKRRSNKSEKRHESNKPLDDRQHVEMAAEDEERTPEWTAKSYKLLRAKYGVPPTELPPLAVERDGALSNGSKLSSVSLPKVPPEKDPGILSSLDSLTPVMSPQKALGLNDTSQDSQRTETIRPKNSTLLVRPSKPKPKQSYLNETRGREDSRRGPEPVYRRPQVMGQSRNNRKNRAPYSEHILLEASAADDHIKNGRFVGQSSRLIPQTSGIGNSSNILPAVRRQPSMYPSRGDRMIGGENYGTLKITYSDLDDQRPPIFDDEAHGSYDTRQPRPNFSVESFRQMLFPLQENISRYGSHQFGGAQGPLPVIYGPARFVPPHRPAPAVRTPPRFDGPRGNNGQRDFRPSPWENAIQRNVH